MSWIRLPGTTLYTSGGESGLPSEHQVCYRVFAVNTQGDSPPSNIACTVPPAAPTNLVATAGPNGFEITWTDNSAYEDGFELYVSTTCTEQPDYWLATLSPNTTRWVGLVDVGACSIVGFSLMATKSGGYSDIVRIP
jgi:hypothetical protein